MNAVCNAARLATRQRPDGRPVMYQSWQKLLMLHWRFDPALIQQWLPAGLTIDTYGGHAWLGLVPFYMRNIRPWWSPTIPHLSHFLELNLRTYAIDRNGVPGVWFFSLNANRRLAVSVARRWFHLPYHYCQMSAGERNGWIDYRAHRRGTAPECTCHYRYRGRGESRAAEPESLEFFLAERYVLFAALPGGGLASGRVHHPPYPLQAAEVDHHDRHLFTLDNLTLPPGHAFDHALYAEGVDVEVFPLISNAR